MLHARAYKIRFLTIYGIKKQKEKITCKNLGQQRYCLINGILNTVELLQDYWCQIKKFYCKSTYIFLPLRGDKNIFLSSLLLLTDQSI
jgi:hypothetical protein